MAFTSPFFCAKGTWCIARGGTLLVLRLPALREVFQRETWQRQRTEEPILHAKIEALAEVMDFVAAHAQKASLPAARVLDVQLAVEEAVTNICLHAYAEEAAVNLLSYSYRATGGFVLRIRQGGSVSTSCKG